MNNLTSRIQAVVRPLFLAVLATTTAAVGFGQPIYFVSDIAGPNFTGVRDGTGPEAQFNTPSGTAVDGTGNVYVADTQNHTIRKVTAAGVVTTLAGLAGSPGSADGTGSAARFFLPKAVAVDGAGNVYVADSGNFTIRKVTPAGVVTTLAGTAGEPGYVDGTGATARFNLGILNDYFNPTLALDGAGNIYVADGNIRKVTPGGVVTTFADQGLAVPSSFTSGLTLGFVHTLAVDAAGNVYCNGYGGGSFGWVKISPTGAALGFFQIGPGSLGSLTVDSAGNVYVYDRNKQTLYRNGARLAGTPTAYYGLGTVSTDGPAGTMGFAFGLSVDGAGNVYFADQNTHAIRRVAPDGSLSTLAGRSGGTPFAYYDQQRVLARDPAGNLYVADYQRSMILRIAPDGTVTPVAGVDRTTGSADGPGAEARFRNPGGVAVDGGGNLYVTDTFNHTIRKITPAGTVSTLAGAAGQEGATDGAGAAARFRRPVGVAVDAAGNVFVADNGNQTIRKITPAGDVSTFAGAVVAGNTSRVDGPAASARFVGPASLAFDNSGNLYVAERPSDAYNVNGALRKITPAGAVSTVSFGENDKNYSGHPLVAVDSTGNVFVTSNNALTMIPPSGPPVALSAINGLFPRTSVSGTPSSTALTGLAVDAQGNLYLADSTDTVRKAAPLSAPDASLAITAQPAGVTVSAGDNFTLSVGATGTGPLSYQWQKDGSDIPGATGATLSFQGAVGASGGSYTVVVMNATRRLASTTAFVVVKARPGVIDLTWTWHPPNEVEADHLPANTVIAGSTVDFSAKAIGSPVPQFQWRRSGGAIAGATGSTTTGYGMLPVYSNTFHLESATIADSGTYSVAATNVAGEATSTTISLLVLPYISRQPAGFFTPLGSTATLSVTAVGAPQLLYQWRKNGVDLPGATQSSLVITNVGPADAADYSVVVSDQVNSAATVASSVARLTITTGQVTPTITSQPGDMWGYGGTYIPYRDFLQVQATGSPSDFSYQWQRAGVAIPGATNATLAFTNGLSLAEVGTYRVVVSNAAGTVVSASANVSLFRGAGVVGPTDLFQVTQAPANQTTPAGGTATFGVTATGLVPLKYQWQKNGVNVPGATSSSFTVDHVSAADEGVYTVIVSGESAEGITVATGVLYSGATARSATLAIGAAATVASPSNQTVATGHNVTFSAGNTASAIQWQVSTDRGTTWANVSNNGPYAGATTAALTVMAADTGLNGNQYRYQASNNGTVTTSGAATLGVLSPPFPFPTAIAADTAGNLFVTDRQANTVQKIAVDRTVSVVAGAAGTAGSLDGTGDAARFNQPGGLAIAANGSLVVADTANAVLRRIAGGTVSSLAGSAGMRGNQDGTGTAASFSNPAGVAIDSAGNLYVADSLNATIRKVSSAGVVTTLAGSPGATGTADAAGTAARFNLPSAVAIDATGNLFVADTNNHTIRKISPPGTVTTFAGIPGVAGSVDGFLHDALFNRPQGLAFDSLGDLYVTDSGNSTIRRINSSGAVSTFAGLPGIAGLQDATSTGFAMFNQPQGLCFDATGNLYVADSGNAAIRKIDRQGNVTTLALTLAPASPPPAGSGTGSTSPTPPAASGTPPTPASSGSGGGGGGGAPSVWFLIVLGGLRLLRRFGRLRTGRP